MAGLRFSSDPPGRCQRFAKKPFAKPAARVCARAGDAGRAGVTHDALGRPNWAFADELAQWLTARGVQRCHLSISDERAMPGLCGAGRRTDRLSLAAQTARSTIKTAGTRGTSSPAHQTTGGPCRTCRHPPIQAMASHSAKMLVMCCCACCSWHRQTDPHPDAPEATQSLDPPMTSPALTT